MNSRIAAILFALALGPLNMGRTLFTGVSKLQGVGSEANAS